MAGFTLFNATHDLLALSMRLRSMRHELLAGNIANADTPGYRAKDIDFAAALRALIARENAPAELPKAGIQLIGARPADFQPGGAIQPALVVQEAEAKLDGNSVDLERQIANLVENSLSYETSLVLLGRKLAALRFAISEGRR